MLCHYVRTYMYHKAFPTRRSSYLECYQRTIRRSFHWVKHTVQTITKLHYGFSVWKVLTSFNSLYAWNTKAGDFGEHFWSQSQFLSPFKKIIPKLSNQFLQL